MMSEIQTVGAFVTSLRAAGDIIKGMLALKLDTETMVKVNELTAVIFEANARANETLISQIAMAERVRELEAQLRAKEDWDTEKRRYEVISTEAGVRLPVLKQEYVDAGEAPQVLCPACFESGVAKTFQPTTDLLKGRRVHRCLSCKNELAFSLSYVPPPSPPTVERSYDAAKRRFEGG